MLLVLVAGVSAGAVEPSEQVHIFYYPWYANPETDGYWSHWNHAADSRDGDPPVYEPPEQLGMNFYPLTGLYSANSREDTRQNLELIKRAGADVVVTTWWGADDFTGKAVPLLLDVAEEVGLKVAFHLEPYRGRDGVRAAYYRDAIVHLIDAFGDHPALYRDVTRGNRPWFYIYDSYLVAPDDWQTVLTQGGNDTIRGTKYDAVCIGLFVKRSDYGVMHRAGFDGFYTYFATNGFTHGSTTKNWPKLAEYAREHGLLFIPSVGPGYDDTRIRPWNTANQRARDGGLYYDQMWQAALDANAEVVSITSYDEWHEGTQIAPATPKTTPTYTYLDYQPQDPYYYIDRTAHWVGELFGKE
jgi:glycoprotein endo-alpha-1,2-mannosidase